MADHIQVNHYEILFAQSTVNRHIGNLVGWKERLQTANQRALQNWRGESEQAFSQLDPQLLAMLDALITELIDINENLESANQAYKKLDGDIAARTR